MENSTNKSSKISPKLRTTILMLVTALFAFFIGRISIAQKPPEIQIREIHPEISLVQLKSIVGDSLQLSISGPVRILWAKENLVENDGDFEVPLSQIPTENDLKYTQFPYTGNAKTMKFYPSNSYFARGVEVRYRRFFRTKERAVGAGFVPSKGVK
jgi:hypothetical protein